ncbi:hypothetical protein [uncultured Bacteroides sp.]|uniref:hypothetical protein n=1 Tax=uncultured Bacteroides sp. TaxID=162156 RepID=UPI002583B3E4|nr:hypothetical protein [uncultured Bacteroides sp.]
MKKIAWFKHPNDLSSDKRLSVPIDHEGGRGYGTYLYIINRTTIHPQKMAQKLYRICETTHKQLIENYQTTWKLLAKMKRDKMMITIGISAINTENRPSRT